VCMGDYNDRMLAIVEKVGERATASTLTLGTVVRHEEEEKEEAETPMGGVARVEKGFPARLTGTWTALA